MMTSKKHWNGVRRSKRRVDPNLIDTGAFLVTFELKSLPEKIRVSMYTCTVRPYIPSPMRCFKCQRFGHTSHRCEGVDTCGDCGKSRHENEECTPPPMCVNCSGEHSPRSRNCPKYKEEKMIQEIKTTEKLSYPEARRKFRS